MKNYVWNTELSKSFIKNYDIKDKQIIINYAKGKEIIPYTKENEEEVKEKMENQFEDFWEYKHISQQNIKNYLVISAFEFALVLFYFLILPKEINGQLLGIIWATASSLQASFLAIKAFAQKNHLNNLLENLYSSKGNEVSNKNFKENQSILTNTNQKVKNIDSNIHEEAVFDINNADALSLKDLKAFMENITKEMPIKKDFESEQPKKLKKKLKKN